MKYRISLILFGIQYDLHYSELRSKVGGISEIQINLNFFGVSLDLYYLCTR